MSDDHTYTLEDRIAELETKALVLQELLTYTVYLLGTNGRAAMVAHIDQLKSTGWLGIRSPSTRRPRSPKRSASFLLT